jgi:hypothetical protein
MLSREENHFMKVEWTMISQQYYTAYDEKAATLIGQEL